MWFIDSIPGSQAVPETGKIALTCLFVSGFLYLVRWLALPKPIPGIPYNVKAANRVMGDIPDFRATHNHREWVALQAVKHQSALVQVFLRPFGKPWVFVSDHHEAADIMMRRMKEFDRADGTINMFHGVVPGHHITLHSSNPQFKKNKELIRDLMTPTFLHEVRHQF